MREKPFGQACNLLKAPATVFCSLENRDPGTGMGTSGNIMGIIPPELYATRTQQNREGGHVFLMVRKVTFREEIERAAPVRGSRGQEANGMVPEVNAGCADILAPTGSKGGCCSAQHDSRVSLPQVERVDRFWLFHPTVHGGLPIHGQPFSIGIHRNLEHGPLFHGHPSCPFQE